MLLFIIFMVSWFFQCSQFNRWSRWIVSGTAAIAFGAFAVLLGINLNLMLLFSQLLLLGQC